MMTKQYMEYIEYDQPTIGDGIGEALRAKDYWSWDQIIEALTQTYGADSEMVKDAKESRRLCEPLE
jgi:hypothetical protein